MSEILCRIQAQAVAQAAGVSPKTVVPSLSISQKAVLGVCERSPNTLMLPTRSPQAAYTTCFAAPAHKQAPINTQRWFHYSSTQINSPEILSPFSRLASHHGAANVMKAHHVALITLGRDCLGLRKEGAIR
jgi:hypothetical protein